MRNNTPIKIGIIGSKNVGKTTLAHLLTATLKMDRCSIGFVPEAAEYSLMPINEFTNLDSAYSLLGTQIAAEAFRCSKHEFVVCDRTVLDTLPFLQVSALHANIELPESKAEEFFHVVLSYLIARPYDILFYIPIRDDYWRSSLSACEKAFRREIDERFQAVINHDDIAQNINVFFVRTANSRDRIKEVMGQVQKIRKAKFSESG